MRFHNLADDTLANAADENLALHAGWVQQQLATMRVLSDAELVIIDSGLLCDTFNLICRARLAEATADRRIHAAIEHFIAARRPFSWWLGPGATPTDLATRLLAAGLEQAETEVAMAIGLEQIEHVARPHPELIIQRVASTEQLRDFASTIGMRETAPDPDVLQFYDLAARVLLTDDAPLWFYVGYLAHVPVATAQLAVGGGVVGLYNISTLPSYRRQGIGTVMTLQPLLDAQQQGHHTAILQASSDGVHVYTKLGFKRFGTITEFKPTW